MIDSDIDIKNKYYLDGGHDIGNSHVDEVINVIYKIIN